MKPTLKLLATFLVSLTCTFCSVSSIAQNVVYYTDTLKALPLKNGPGAELLLSNSTKSINGFLLNYGNGNTKFKLGIDSIWSAGSDTIKWRYTDGTIAYKIASSGSIEGIAAGGDLSGTYPNPTVAQFNGQLPAYYLDRANHTGTQTISTLSDFPTDVSFFANDAGYLTEIPSENFTWRVRDSVCDRPAYDLDDGDKFLVCPSPTGGGEFEDEGNNIAIYHSDGDTFAFQIPNSGDYLQNNSSGAVDKYDGVNWVYQYTTKKLTNGGERDSIFASFGQQLNYGAEIKTNNVRRWFWLANGQVRIITAPTTYSTGSYDILVRNQTTKNVEKISSSTLQPQLNGTGFVKATGTTISYDNSTYLTANQTISFTPSGDVSSTGGSSATSLTPAVTVTGIKGVSVPTLSTGLLKYNGSAWVFDNTSYLSGTVGISNGGTNITSYTTGDILYYNGSALAKLPIGTTSQTLHVVAGVPAWRDTTASAGGGTPAGSDTYVQYNSSGSFGASANFTYGSSLLTLFNNSITTTTTSALALRNTTAASSGNQIFSPALRFDGQGWKTTATAASQNVRMDIDMQPVQGTANPTGKLIFTPSVNSNGTGAYYNFGTDGRAIFNGIGTGNSGLSLYSGGMGINVDANASTSPLIVGTNNSANYLSLISSSGAVTSQGFTAISFSLPTTVANMGNGLYIGSKITLSNPSTTVTTASAGFYGYMSLVNLGNANAGSVAIPVPIHVGFDEQMNINTGNVKNITDNYGMRIRFTSVDANPTGKVVNNYGIYIASVSSNYYTTTNVGFWQDGTTATNIFNGKNIFGDNTYASAKATITNKGSIQTGNYRTTTSTTSLDGSDYTLDCTSGTYAVNLPAAATYGSIEYEVINSGAGTITLTASGVEIIGNSGSSTTYSITAGSSVTVVSNNVSSWRIK